MAKRTSSVSAPLTFDLPLSLISKIETCRRGRGLKTASEVIRLALDQYDFETYHPNHDPHRQISVRISARQRSSLKRHARTKHASVGELLRLALETLPSRASSKKGRG
jgi:Arc/MetJ-type ribon-helix-helix transcriptional regulator